MSRKMVYRCDTCGEVIQSGTIYRLQYCFFHVEIGHKKHVCEDCLEQLKAMREANILAERNDE